MIDGMVHALEIENAALRERVEQLETLLRAGVDVVEELHRDLDDPTDAEVEFVQIAKAALAASKRAGDAEVAESAERMADKHDDTLRSLADGPHDHDHLAGGEGE